MKKMSKAKMREMVRITCYNQTETMRRDKAIEFYLDCMMNSEGSENERYQTIYFQLMQGDTQCSDMIPHHRI